MLVKNSPYDNSEIHSNMRTVQAFIRVQLNQ